MIQRWLASSVTTMSLPTEKRSSTWRSGAPTTTWLSTQIRPKSSLWTSGRKVAHTPPSISTGRWLSVSPTSSSWVSISLMTSLGPSTPGQEIIPASLLPEETEEGPSVSSDSGEFLPLHHREHPHQLHLSVVWQLLCCRPEITAEGGENCSTHHRFHTPHHRSCPEEEMSAEGPQHRQGQLSPQPQTVCPPPFWEALQGPPFPDQQVQEQLHPCGCHPAELWNTAIAAAPHPPPPHTPCPLTILPPSTLAWTATHPPPTTEHLNIYTFALTATFFTTVLPRL